MANNPDRWTLKLAVGEEDPKVAADFLLAHSELSKAKIKEAMTKGAVWLVRKKKHRSHIRKGRATLRRGDQVLLFYDARLLAIEPPEPEMIADRKEYSVWFKPVGMLAQGTEFGDHCSLLRFAEKNFNSRQTFLVHRLDREASGVMIIAHSRQAAAKLSVQFQEKSVTKKYLVEVRGQLPKSGVVDRALDGKKAHTEYRSLGYDETRKVSRAEVSILTGRQHQIRRHLADIGFPVMGDPRYGKGNKNRKGLKLIANSLEVTCPVSGEPICFTLTPEQQGSLSGAHLPPEPTGAE